MSSTETVTVDDTLKLVDQLEDALGRAARAQTEAIGICERLTQACENLHGDTAWGLVAVEAGCVRDVLPGGGSEGDPLHTFSLVRDLAELAARRS